MKPFDPRKPCKTRDGREVKIYAVYPEKGYMHAAFFRKEIDSWLCGSWQLNGMCLGHTDEDTDIINIPVKHKIKVWINLYKNTTRCNWHISREDADSFKDYGRTACLEREFEYEEGEGL